MTAPRIGMFATVRNRRGITTSIEPLDGTSADWRVI